MEKPYIRHGGKKHFFEVPNGWRLGTFADIADAPPLPDVKALVRERIRKPEAAPPLSDAVSSGKTVAILVEDLTRTSPKRTILDVVLDELRLAGIQKRDITIVIALGTHRPLSDEELKAAFGVETVRDYRFVDHDCHADDLVAVGRLTSGREVRINRHVAEADFKLGIGSVFPHPMNGFGGGCKILFPGVADFDSILDHHFRLTFEPGTQLGNVETNLFYQEVCEVGRAAGLDFIVNSVMDPEDRACDVVAGDPVKAHLLGVEKSRKAISYPFAEKADVTLITSFPYAEGPQIVKPLIPGAMTTKENGVIIWAVDSDTGLPEPFLDSFRNFHARHGQNLLDGVLKHFQEKRLIMDPGPIDFNMALGLVLSVQHRFRLIMVTKDLTKAQAEKMGVMYAETLEGAFEKVSGMIPRPLFHVIPSGGVFLPVFIKKK